MVSSFGSSRESSPSDLGLPLPYFPSSQRHERKCCPPVAPGDGRAGGLAWSVAARAGGLPITTWRRDGSSAHSRALGAPIARECAGPARGGIGEPERAACAWATSLVRASATAARGRRNAYSVAARRKLPRPARAARGATVRAHASATRGSTARSAVSPGASIASSWSRRRASRAPSVSGLPKRRFAGATA